MEKNITDENFIEKITALNKLVLVDFFATWCGPCQVLGPVLEKIAEHFKEKLVLIKANVDNFPITSQKFGVEKIPMVVMFKNGKQISSFIGLIPEQKIKDWIENIIKTV